MTDPDHWTRDNDAYLAAALEWLRLRLAAVADRGPVADPGPAADRGPAIVPVPAIPAEVAAAVRRGRFARRRPELPPAPPHRLALDPAPGDRPARPAAGSGSAVEAAAKRMTQAAAAMSPPPALLQLGELFGLSRFEREVLLLCAAVELDGRLTALCAEVQGEAWPSVALALRAFDDPEWTVLSPERPLRCWHLVELPDRPSGPLSTCPLRADDRIVGVVKGMHHLDQRLIGLVRPVEAPDRPLPPSQRAVADAGAAVLRGAAGGPAAVLQLVGPDPASRRRVAAQIADGIGARLRLLPAHLLPDGPDADLIARLWHREAVLTGAVLYLDDEPPGWGGEAGPPGRAVGRFLDRSGGAVLVGGAEVLPDLPATTSVLDVARPTAAEQRAAWDEALGAESDVDTAALVQQFDLDEQAIRTIAAQAEVRPPPTGDTGAEEPTDRVWDACRRSSRPRLESLAQRVEPVATWDQLVLPERETALLRQIADQVGLRGTVYGDWGFGARMNRGLGITALFAGDPGTGKSMAAEVLAGQLRLDLYRIDLSGVVSKYIGETEKNLRRLFDAAESGGVLLFFDEADALFGKRSEVRDSHDRYANMEVGYLLQRMEVYRGLAVLATNMRTALDRAFLRRLRFVVSFPVPSAAERERMWRAVLPPEVPTDGLDPVRLARLDLTGAGIRDAALNGAFLAAAEGRPLGMPHVLRAARAELVKLQRPVTEADFRLTGRATP